MSAVLFALGALALLVWLFLRRRLAVLLGEVIYRDTDEAPTLISHRYRLVVGPTM